ncbi:MAG: DUF3592 domain-containing protein, partial [Myxococcales bacterium]|nr:DUF3592 domain-containing protein [Myxococcales bacterium]
MEPLIPAGVWLEAPLHAEILLLVGVGLFSIAAITLLGGVWLKRTTRWWKRYGVSTPGRCVRIKERDEYTTYYVQYLDGAGRVHETHTQGSVIAMSLGAVVEVWVDPSNPANARIAAEVKLQHVVTLILAGVFG